MLSIQQDKCWMDPYISYVKEGKISEDKSKAQKLRMKASRFLIIDDELYRKSFAGPLLLCVTKQKGKEVLSEIHEGQARYHSGARALQHKVLRQCYYWPTLRYNAKEFVHKWEKCQKHGSLIHNHQNSSAQ